MMRIIGGIGLSMRWMHWMEIATDIANTHLKYTDLDDYTESSGVNNVNVSLQTRPVY